MNGLSINIITSNKDLIMNILNLLKRENKYIISRFDKDEEGSSNIEQTSNKER